MINNIIIIKNDNNNKTALGALLHGLGVTALLHGSKLNNHLLKYSYIVTIFAKKICFNPE